MNQSGTASFGLDGPPAAIILDFDGVVIDSLKVHLAAWDVAHRQLFGHPMGDPATIIGRGTLAIAGILATRAGASGLARDLARLKREHLVTMASGIQPLPGSRAFMEAAFRAGIPTGIASNSPRAFVTSVVADLGLDGLVGVCLGAEDAKRLKPEPDLFLAAARRLGLAPEHDRRILVFEDSLHGLAAARRAGMIPVGIASEQSPPALIKAGAVAAFADLGAALTAGVMNDLRSLRPL